MSFGTSYAGLSGLGLGVPEGLPAPGAAYPRGVDLSPARAIDLLARDYAVDLAATGAPHEAWDGLAQNVILRLTTPRGSLGHLPDFGNRFLARRTLPARLIETARQDVAEALVDLLAAGTVALVDVLAERLPAGGAAVAVVWRDLRTGEERTTRVG